MSMASMTGKRVLVTGATAGIGLETARGLAKQGAEVIIAGRDEAKTKAVVEQLKASTGNQQLDFVLGDLSTLAGTRKVATDFLAKYSTLNVLVNNAGAIMMSREVTADGFERTFATNHLSYFLLTNLLLPALERGAPARIVSVASGAHQGAELDFDDLQSEKGYAAFKAYGRSKLANILFTRELARRVKDKRITANCLHPGVVGSNFLAGKAGVWGAVGRFANLFMITPEKGAQTSLYLSTSNEVEGVTGDYFDKCRKASTSKPAQDDAVAAKLWAVSEKLVGLA
jgi:NAD(P)-dependent dehydrogenase (short-subunit alcohol dehydrogenase family)